MNNETLLLVFVALTGAAVLLQAILLLALYVTLSKTVNFLREEVEDLHSAVLPVITNSREFLLRVGPKIESLTADVADLAHALHAQSTELQSSVTEILERARRQTSRVDAMCTSVLDTVDRAGGFVAGAVSMPIRQLSAVAAAAKAVLSTLRTRSSEPRQTHSPADRDQFI